MKKRIALIPVLCMMLIIGLLFTSCNSNPPPSEDITQSKTDVTDDSNTPSYVPDSSNTSPENTETEFIETEFSETEFSETEFSETEFSETEFSETEFSETEFSETEFSETESSEIQEQDFEIKVNYAWEISDGIANVMYEVKDTQTNNSSYYSVAIDSNGKVLFHAPNGFTPFKNGMMIIENTVYDKSGKVIASPEISGYDKLLSDNTYEYLLAYKKEESFSGDTCYLGVLNNKGEWVTPLSDQHPIIELFKLKNEDIDSIYFGDDYIGNNILSFFIGFGDIYYYDISQNKLSTNYIHFEEEYYQGNPGGIYKYDENGDKVLIITPREDELLSISHVFDDSILCYYDHFGGNSEYILFDHSGNLLQTYEMYNISEIISRYNGYLFCLIKNPTGTDYVSLIKPDGKLAFEPFKMESTYSIDALHSYGFLIDNYEFGNHSYTFYDYFGNATKLTDISQILSAFDNGLALAYTKNEEFVYTNYKGEIIIDPLKIDLSEIIKAK